MLGDSHKMAWILFVAASVLLLCSAGSLLAIAARKWLPYVTATVREHRISELKGPRARALTFVVTYELADGNSGVLRFRFPGVDRLKALASRRYAALESKYSPGAKIELYFVPSLQWL